MKNSWLKAWFSKGAPLMNSIFCGTQFYLANLETAFAGRNLEPGTWEESRYDRTPLANLWCAFPREEP